MQSAGLDGVEADIHEKTSPGLVIGLRLSGDERSHEGLEAGEIQDACERIAVDGHLTYLSVVAGSSAILAGSIHIAPPVFEDVGYTAPLADGIRARTGLPTIVTGRINQPQDAERKLGIPHHLFGDCISPRTAEEAVLEGLRIGLTV